MRSSELAFAVKTATLKRDAGRLYSELLRNEKLPPEALASLTSSRAREIAAFAFEKTAFYRDLYSGSGITADDLRDPESFQSLPIIDRTAVKEHTARMRSSEATVRTMRLGVTGGSTGQPIGTVNDARVPLLPLSWRMYSWWGVQPWDNLAHVGRWPQTRRQRFTTNLTWWPTKVIFLDAASMDWRAIEAFVHSVNTYRPSLIEGYVGALRVVADYLREHRVTFAAPRAIGVTAAPLTAEVRRQIESSLRAPVYDHYRSGEVQWLAGECTEHSGLHVFSDMRKIEIVNEDGEVLPPGEAGYVVVTDLTNRVFPMVRYRLGDRGTLRDRRCPCGVSLPLMEPPDGRGIDVIRLPDGTAVAGGLVGIFSAVADSVRVFQLHQRADYSIELRVVIGEDPRAAENIVDVAERLRERFERQVEVTVTYVDSIPYTRGKLHYIISDVATSGSAPGLDHEP